MDRRLIVQTLITSLEADQIDVTGLLIAADDLARDQWIRFLGGAGGVPPAGWTVQTPAAVLTGGGHVSAECVVIADELETYLTEQLAAALTGARAILGLCASPSGLSDSHRFRKYIGRFLGPTGASGPLDVLPLAGARQFAAGDSELDGSDDSREQLLTVSDPQDFLNFYLTQAQKIPLLNAVEEIVLAEQIEAGVLAAALHAGLPGVRCRGAQPANDELVALIVQGHAAEERFLTSNLRLVYSIARRFSRRMEIMDAVQEGNIGLIRAIMKFDHRKGYKFSTYATWWIRQAITRAIADQIYLIRLPVHLHESDGPVVSEWRRREREDEDTSAAGIASTLNMDASKVQVILQRHRRPYSLEAMAEEGIDVIDPFADLMDEQFSLSMMQDSLHEVLETLPEREMGVVSMRFGLTDGETKTLDQIGQVYGVTRERIRQIQSKAMTKLRHPSHSAGLRGYFEGMCDPELVTEDSEL